MADSFAKKAALDIGELGASLRETASGFAEVSEQVERFAVAREANVSVAQKELAVLNRGLSTAKEFNTTLETGRRLGDATVQTNSGRGGGAVTTSDPPAGSVLAALNAPPAAGSVLAAVNGPGGGEGVLASVNGPKGESGVVAEVNGKEIADGVIAGMGRSVSAGERGIRAAINSGFARLDRTIRTSTPSGDGGASFRAGGGV